MLKPLTLIVGSSGKGKSTSIRNLDPKTTAIFNIENKPLPFPNAKEFTKMVTPKKASDMITQLKEVIKKDDIEIIVIDSFTSWMEALEEECINAFPNEKRFDSWNLYNRQMRNLFQLIKSSEKYVFMIGIHEVINSEDGEKVKRLKTVGKRWEGLCEKEAVSVLWSTTNTKGKAEDGSPIIEYVFETKTDGFTSAKSPMGLFETFLIDNDLKLVVDAYKKFYKEEVVPITVKGNDSGKDLGKGVDAPKGTVH